MIAGNLGTMKTPSLFAALLTTLCLPSAAEETPLARFFDARQVETAYEYHQAFLAAKTAEDVQALYRRTFALEATLLGPLQKDDAIWPSLESFLEADLSLPGLSASCVAECTMPALQLDVPTFQAKAAHTEGQDDDAFFDLLEDFYGPSVPLADGRLAGWPSFFEPTWDYGGHSLLGDGTHLRLLQSIGKLRKSPTKLFAEEVEELRKAVLTDLLSGSSCAGLSAPEAIAELAQILDSVELDDEERRSVTKRREAFADPAAHGIEVGCREMTCSCNSG